MNTEKKGTSRMLHRIGPMVGAIVGTVVLAACDPDASEQDRNDPSWTLVTPHFRVELTAADLPDSTHIRSILEDNHTRVTSDLRVDSIPAITLTFHPTGTAFRAAVGMPGLPSWVVGIATGPARLHVISPRSPDAGQPFEEMMKILVHEFTHCVTLNISATFANNPRWLWEGVAMYEAGQFQHPSSISGWPDELPTLASLNANWQTNTDVYGAGYVIVEYVGTTWGRDTLKRLIASNGNIPSTLGVSVQAFEQGWWQFLRSKYGGS